MRNTRIPALFAGSALAATTILGGAAMASAEEGPNEVDSATIVMKAGGSEEEDADGRYTLTATAFDNCTVVFDLEDNWPGAYEPNWRADYRVGDEPAVMPGSSRGGDTYRPVLGNAQRIEDAINNRENPYDFATGEATVDLTEPRVVPKYEDVDEVVTRQGVEPNEDGTHVITFGVYQGPNTAASNEYSFNTTVTVEGCPTIPVEDEAETGGLVGSIIGSVDVFGSLRSAS